MGRPKLLLLDEPSLGLSPLLVTQIFRIIRRINQEQGVATLGTDCQVRWGAAYCLATDGFTGATHVQRLRPSRGDRGGAAW